MSENINGPDYIDEVTGKYKADGKRKQNYFLHIVLFALTFLTTLDAGLEWIAGNQITDLSRLVEGLPYAICTLLFLGSHEFGHYFASRYHKVDATLPYFIPFTTFGLDFINFGTMGAVIKTRGYIPNRRALFDIGAAGPIAGFIVCLIILIYGFTHVPGQEYILKIHPDYYSPDYGKQGIALTFGNSILFIILKNIFVNPGQFFPPMSEIYHYPYLCVGWFGLFVTSMNMIPVGQLDGGHIIYAMFGEKKHYSIAGIGMILLTILGIAGILSVWLPWISFGWPGWLFWAIILFFVIKIKHPAIYDPEPLTRGRMITGYISLAIFILSFTPTPLMIAIK